jgi:hypothetical protein
MQHPKCTQQTHQHPPPHSTNQNQPRTCDRHTPKCNKETWQQALTFLNHLNIEPPPFRSTTCRHTQALTKVELFATCHNLNKWTLLASAPLNPNHQHVNPTNNASDPLWKLLFIIEALILFPPPKQQKLANCSRIAQARMRQFRRGDIIASHEEAFDLDKCTAPSVTPPSFNNATTLSHSAQAAADADNYGVASQRMQSCMPTVTITNEMSEEIKNLCPERINFPSPTSEPTCPEHTQHTTRTTKKKSNHNNPPNTTTPHQPRLNNPPITQHQKGNCTRAIHTQHRLHPSMCTHEKQTTRGQRTHAP